MKYHDRVLAITNAYALGARDYPSTVRALVDVHVAKQ